VKILVTGGTGFIGKELVRRLVSRGDDVVVFSRSAKTRDGRVETVAWTPELAGPWMDTLASVDGVIHLAGQGIMESRWTPAFLETCRRSRVVPTTLLAEAMATCAAAGGKCKTWVSASAVGYYGLNTGDAIIDETSAPAADNLATMCLEWEAATKRAEDAGVRTLHARIGIVLGKGGGAMEKMLPAYRAFVGGPVGKGTQYFPWIHLADAVGALLFALDESNMRGVFNVTAPNPVTADVFAQALGKALARPAFFRVPEFALRLALGEQSRVLVGGQRVVPKKLDDARFPFLYPEIDGALRDIVA
jgi:uncharacterized protein